LADTAQAQLVAFESNAIQVGNKSGTMQVHLLEVPETAILQLNSSQKE
jgi:hypothetical protein